MAGSMGSGSGDDETISAINVTPLVDVVLVLLVIFMISAPVVYQSALQVDLPKAKSGAQVAGQPLDFTLRKSGELFQAGKALSWEELETRAKKGEFQSYAEQAIVITADESAAHGLVVKLMDILRASGLTRFALHVDSR